MVDFIQLIFFLETNLKRPCQPKFADLVRSRNLLLSLTEVLPQRTVAKATVKYVVETKEMPQTPE